jgi:hypothetical protein
MIPSTKPATPVSPSKLEVMFTSAWSPCAVTVNVVTRPEAAAVGLNQGSARLRLGDVHAELPDAAGEFDLEADDAARADSTLLDFVVVEGGRQKPGVKLHVCQVAVDLVGGGVDGPRRR